MMMRLRMPLFGLIAGMVLGFGMPAAHADQALFGRQGSFVDQADPDAFQLPGVPDRNGCVKLCLRDDSPCDPEYFKHADGRCTNNTNSGH